MRAWQILHQRKDETGRGGWYHPQGWWLLSLDVKSPLFGLGGPSLALAAWTGLEKTTLTL